LYLIYRSFFTKFLGVIMFKSFFVILATLFATSAFGAEYIVKYKDNKAEFYTESFGFKILNTHDEANLMLVDIPDGKLKELKSNDNIEYVVPNAKVYAFETVEDGVAMQEQWALAKVKAAGAWGLAGNKGSSQVIVAVIDTGVDSTHESLKANMVPGYDFRDNDDDPNDVTSSANPGHGTHCAGIIGATGSVENGVSGLVQQVSIMPIRFLGSDGSGDLMGAIKSIDYAIEKKAHIISASWGATIPRSQATPLLEAIERADKAGIIFISAAANDGKNNDTTDVFPANAGYPNSITVAASGSNDEKPSWSNYGKATVHVAAPGLNILSTLPGNKYQNLSGTSMATPLVAGLAAFILSQNPDLTGAEVRALLQTTGAAVDIQTACNCRIDAEAATKAVLENAKWLVPAAASLKAAETMQFTLKNSTGAVSYSSSNTEAATVDASGLLTAVATGETTVKAVDQDGTIVESLAIRVIGEGGGDTPTPGEDCPLGDATMCEAMCAIIPTLPWCAR